MADQFDERFSNPEALRLAREMAARSAARQAAVARGAAPAPTSMTPSQIASRMRLPEEDPNYVNDPNRALLAPLMIYGGALGPEVAGALGGAGRVAPAAARAASPMTGRALTLTESPAASTLRPATEAEDLAFRTFSNVRDLTPYEQALANRAAAARNVYREPVGPVQPASRNIYESPIGPTQPASRNIYESPIGPTQPATRNIYESPIGPQAPRPGEPGFIGPVEPIGPQIPKPGESGFIGPLEQYGPRALPRPGEPSFIGPMQPIGPMRPSVASPMSLPAAAGTIAAGAVPLAASASLPSAAPSVNDVVYDPMGNVAIPGVTLPSAGAGRGFINEQPDARYAANAVGSGRGAAPPKMEDYLADRAKALSANAALDAARARMAAAQATGERAGLPPARPSASSDGLFSKIFSGKDYQSNSELVNKPMGGAPINWGSPDSAADFFRADKALAQMKAQQDADAASGAPTERRGGSVTGKGQGQSEKPPDPIHKALEIIHALLVRH